MELNSTNVAASDRTFALAHLTLLGLAPPRMAEVAAEAGFTHIGVRVVPATTNEVRYDLRVGTPLLRETRKALDDNGIRVLDIEALSLRADTSPDTWLPALESGATLGASVFNVIGADADISRLTDTFARLAADAATFGIRASLEPISYRELSTLSAAARIVEQTETGGIMLDTTHFQRAGSVPEDIDSVPGDLLTVVQLCDGPETVPTDIVIPDYSPMGATPDATPRSIEARVRRDLPGDGTFPLSAILNRIPAEVPISVEVPNPVLINEIGEREYARRAYRAAVTVTDRALLTDSPQGHA
ncbi:sugar phosphate isomerase/epimerase family protein [Rhodococcus opacus]|uniref:sugar phosphate isomerase/epimerase family protein n=1 Tax=Rhodococcus opacus TaxID=37919 RepID=UPI001C48A2F1|nr:TIM barrel protein [Rhodococcus opacus]MBV6760254.1 sugar phosphate isomerase/epimerase [Rhodococcus opacus]